jgi:hypothetical protein
MNPNVPGKSKLLKVRRGVDRPQVRPGTEKIGYRACLQVDFTEEKEMIIPQRQIGRSVMHGKKLKHRPGHTLGTARRQQRDSPRHSCRMARGEDSNKLPLVDERCHKCSGWPTHLFMASEGAAATDLRWDGLDFFWFKRINFIVESLNTT